MTVRPALTVMLVSALLSVHGSAAATRLLGFARDAATQRYLYTEVHDNQTTADGALLQGQTLYYDPQGREVARRSLDFRANRTVPVYRLDVPGQGYSEGITSLTPALTVFKSDQGRVERKSITPEGELIAADAGFNNLMLSQFRQIQAGETVRFTLVVAGRTDSFRFRARKVGEDTVNGEAAVRVKVEPDSVLRMLVEPIELVYDAKGSRLLRYTGVSNLLDPATRQVYRKVVITYGGPVPPEAQIPGAGVPTSR